MTDQPRQSIAVDGVRLTLEVRRGRVRNVNARLTGSHLRVSAPASLPGGELERIVHELARTLLRRRRSRELNRDGHVLRLARRVAQRFPEPPAVAEVAFSTVQRARWGSYSPATGAIRLHAALASMPPWVVEAVIAHELVHAFHRNHGPGFWALLRSVCPDTDRARAFLAGVSWLARRYDSLSPAERRQLGAASPLDPGGQ